MGLERPTSTEEPAAFTHTPLDLSTSSIRLIRIQPGSISDPIQSTLETIAHTEDAYFCLSYTWGSELPIKHISIHGQKLTIRENLWNFLRLGRKLRISD
jgi:Heterokaryon incompatibility protein (HET)